MLSFSSVPGPIYFQTEVIWETWLAKFKICASVWEGDAEISKYIKILEIVLITIIIIAIK